MRGMQMQFSDENSLCSSVHQMHASWQSGRKISPDFYTIRKIIWPSFFQKKNDWREATPSTWNFGSAGPCWREIADLQPIIARSSSAVTPSEKVQLTLIESLLLTFQ